MLRFDSEKAVVSMGPRVRAVSDRVEGYLTRNNLFAVFVAGRSWETGPGGAIGTSMLTVFEPRAFRHEVRERVTWEGAGKDPDEMVWILNEVKETNVQHETVEAPNIAAAGITGRRCEAKTPAKQGGG